MGRTGLYSKFFLYFCKQNELNVIGGYNTMKYMKHH